MTPEAMLALRGRLLTEYFATAVMPSAFAADLDPDGARGAHASFIRLQRSWTLALGPASGVRAVFDLAAAPFCALLHLGIGDPLAMGSGVLAAPLRAGGRDVATLLVTTWSASLDQRWRDGVQAGRARGTRWCLCFNARAVRLIDATRGHARAHLEFDLDALAGEPRAFDLLWTALRASSFEEGPRPSRLDRLIDASLQTGEAVCASLRHGVLESVALLVNGLAQARGRARRSAPPDPPIVAAVFEQALTLVYRVLFLLFAEARQLVPQWHPVYRDRYTIAALAHLAATGRPPRGVWEALQAISRLAHAGCDAGDLRVTPFNGRLFSPSATPLGEHARVDDSVARDALVALTTTQPRRGGRERIAYRDLGVEELGRVYETVLDYTPAVEPLAGAPGRWRVALTHGGHARKDSSAFYTPRALTDVLVERTLAPLVRGRDPDGILRLRIVDPAMGSGAFLVSACRHLARAYEDALVETGCCLPGDLGDEDRARFRRLVAQRCLFGVDLDPRAVQLARLSLWLATLAADCPLTFLDHHLRTGDSLVGAAPADVARQPPGRTRVRAAGMPLFDLDDFHGALSSLVPARERIASEPGDTIAAVREKERALAALAAPAHGAARWKAVCDLWCACWFWRDGPAPDPRLFRDLAERLHGRPAMLTSAAAEAHLSRARTIAAGLRCFHWTLEFPEVFYDAAGRPLGDAAGFDAVVGNPPWDMIRADRAGGAGDEERTRAQQLTRFARASGVFAVNTEGHANRYQLFVERALQIVRHGGRVGLVVPSGLATDRGSAGLRRSLFHGCDTDALIGFDNRDGVFPIHRSTRFLLVTTTRGGSTRELRCRFGVRRPEAIDAAGAGDACESVAIAPSLLHRVSGDDLAVPEIHTRLDLAILEKIASSAPALADPAGWGARFGRELNATDDRRHFVGGPDALPVLEGKDIAPFAVRVPADVRRIRAADAERLLGRVPGRRLAYRDVASATNRLTLIAAILPDRTVTTHTLFCLRTPLPVRVQRFLCGVFNSFVANYLIRMRVTTHVGVGPIERLPVPRPPIESGAVDAIVRLVARLEHAAGDEGDAYIELQARVAALYGLSDAEWTHVVGTFRLIDEGVRAAAIGLYRAGVLPRRHEGTTAD